MSVIAIPVSTILLFVIPTGIPLVAKVIWATLAYMLWDTAYTLCDVPIFGIVTTMTLDQKERVSLNSIGRIFAIFCRHCDRHPFCRWSDRVWAAGLRL